MRTEFSIVGVLNHKQALPWREKCDVTVNCYIAEVVNSYIAEVVKSYIAKVGNPYIRPLVCVSNVLGGTHLEGAELIDQGWPSKMLIRATLRLRQYYAGMKTKFIGDEEMIFCYGERNSPQPGKPSLVFVHGFSSSKDQWISCFNGLPKDLHMIAVDLPGHGFSSRPADDIELGLEYAVVTFNKFLQLVGLYDQKLHLVGSSLGGAIVGLYAAKHPEKVAKVTMICPAMKTPIDSNFAVQLRDALTVGHENLTYNHSVLLANDVQSLKNLLECSCYNKTVLKLSDQFFKGFLTLRLPKMDFYLRLFKAITKEEHFDLLANLAHQINIPSQLIWGKEDELIHVSGADLLKSKLPNCRYVDIIENCGHAIDLDRPGALNKHLLKYGSLVAINLLCLTVLASTCSSLHGIPSVKKFHFIGMSKDVKNILPIYYKNGIC
ncbi:Alpha beta hydrolase [Bulinus truncatus]|nr:Alpha beta hydrolase [Bulinus truncatus]